MSSVMPVLRRRILSGQRKVRRRHGMKDTPEIGPCNKCGFPSREPVCGPCTDPREDLPGIPMVLTILISGIVLGGGILLALWRLK